jgi:predicted HTH transcriptional regulator
MQLPSLLFGILLGITASYLFFQKEISKLSKECYKLRKEKADLLQELQETEECGNGLDRFAERMRAKKEIAKGKILTALRAKGALKNEDITKLTDISSATVVRYMDELEAEGKVIQEGKTGRGVVYRINASNGA